LRVKLAGRDQSGLVVVGQIARQAADHERLHGGAGPGLHASADTEAEAAPRVWIVAERHVVAAEGEAVDLGPMTAMPMEPKPSTVPLLSTSKGLSAALEAVKMPTLWPAETRMVKLSLVKVNEPGPPVVVTVPPLTIDTRLPFAAVPAAAKIPI
jgi:hypothetical protein